MHNAMSATVAMLATGKAPEGACKRIRSPAATIMMSAALPVNKEITGNANSGMRAIPPAPTLLFARVLARSVRPTPHVAVYRATAGQSDTVCSTTSVRRSGCIAFYDLPGL